MKLSNQHGTYRPLSCCFADYWHLFCEFLEKREAESEHNFPSKSYIAGSDISLQPRKTELERSTKNADRATMQCPTLRLDKYTALVVSILTLATFALLLAFPSQPPQFVNVGANTAKAYLAFPNGSVRPLVPDGAKIGTSFISRRKLPRSLKITTDSKLSGFQFSCKTLYPINEPVHNLFQRVPSGRVSVSKDEYTIPFPNLNTKTFRQCSLLKLSMKGGPNWFIAPLRQDLKVSLGHSAAQKELFLEDSPDLSSVLASKDIIGIQLKNLVPAGIELKNSAVSFGLRDKRSREKLYLSKSNLAAPVEMSCSPTDIRTGACKVRTGSALGGLEQILPDGGALQIKISSVRNNRNGSKSDYKSPVLAVLVSQISTATPTPTPTRGTPGNPANPPPGTPSPNLTPNPTSPSCDGATRTCKIKNEGSFIWEGAAGCPNLSCEQGTGCTPESKSTSESPPCETLTGPSESSEFTLITDISCLDGSGNSSGQQIGNFHYSTLRGSNVVADSSDSSACSFRKTIGAESRSGTSHRTDTRTLSAGGLNGSQMIVIRGDCSSSDNSCPPPYSNQQSYVMVDGTCGDEGCPAAPSLEVSIGQMRGLAQSQNSYTLSTSCANSILTTYETGTYRIITGESGVISVASTSTGCGALTCQNRSSITGQFSRVVAAPGGC